MQHPNLCAAACGASLFLLAACGGGSGSGDSGGAASSTLSVPSQMTIVDAHDQQTGNLGGVGRATSGSDYENDPVRIWVHDDSMGPLEIINSILCSLEQTGYQDPTTLNAGPYLALIETTRCEQSGGSGGGGSQASSSQNALEYEEWIVDSSRASDTAPQVVKFWIDWDEEMGPSGETVAARLYGRLTITESPSEAMPYGRFVLHFKLLARAADPGSQDVLFRGTLGTSEAGEGVAEYAFYMENGDVDGVLEPGGYSSLERARVRSTPDGLTGRAFTSAQRRFHDGQQVFSEDETFHVTFDDAYLARKRVSGNQEIRVFDRNDFETHAWRYGLYHAANGDRVALQSGFPIRGPNGEHGWAGHWGIWFPEEVEVTAGMQVTRERYGEPGDGGDPEIYTVFVAPGRLMRRTRIASTLGGVAGEEMQWWSHRTNTQKRVKWLDGALVCVGNWDDQDERWVPVDPPQSLMEQFGPDEWVGLWSDGRGEVNFVWPSQGAPTDATPVTIWAQQQVTQSAPELAQGNLPLLGYQRALRAGITAEQALWQNGQSPYLPDAQDVLSGYQYVFDKATLTLMLDGQPVTLAGEMPPNVLEQIHGFDTGPMLTAPPPSFRALHEAEVAYRWETGPREWNQTRLLLDANGDVVAFDPPLAVSYTHDEPGHPMDGKTFRLEYQGHGDLHGIPHREDPQGRWYPLLTIPTGSVVSDDDGSFRVKILEAEQKMVEVSDPMQVLSDRGLDLDIELTPPTDTWQEPAIGARPEVADAPRFVGGEAQSGSTD